jgi:hypothetical protein
MKWILIALSLALFHVSGQCAPASPVTRASSLHGLAAGVGMSMTMPDYLAAFPNARTSIFAYLKLDTPEVEAMVSYLDIQVEAQQQAGRDFWPQIALETGHLTLSRFRHELAQPDSLVARNVRLLAANVARYRDSKKWFFIRPFCEMNDGTLENPWEFANPNVTNTPADFAAAWKLLRETFAAEGASNAIFIFSPLAAHHVHHEKEVLTALNLIPPGYIDAYGPNVYSRPLTAYGGASPEPIPFATLAQPWLDLLARSRHRGIPLAVPEMGVSRQASDARRASWLRSAFRFARAHNFVLMTYFNYTHPYWQIDETSQAGATLRACMSEEPPVASHPVATPAAAATGASRKKSETVALAGRHIAIPPVAVTEHRAPSVAANERHSPSVAATRQVPPPAAEPQHVPPPIPATERRPPPVDDAPDLKEYRTLDPQLREEICATGDGLVVVIDPDQLPGGMLPFIRIDRIVGRKLKPVEDRAGLHLVVYGGDGGEEVVESSWFKLRRLPDHRIALIWERSKEGGPEPGDYLLRYYVSGSRLASGVQPNDLTTVQRLHCDDTAPR